MVECPVCGGVNTLGETACEVCGLPNELVDVVRGTGELPTGPPAVLAESNTTVALAAIPAGIDRPEGPSPPTPPSKLEESTPPVVYTVEVPTIEVGPVAVDPPGALGDALRIGRSLGMDLTGVERDLAEAPSEPGSTQVTRIRRELIRSVLDQLMDRYRELCARRNALSPVVRTQSLDAELASYRRALSEGKLPQAAEHRTSAEAMVVSIETSWRRIKDQFSEAGQMIQALRELGGVAPAVLRPVAEAIRIPRKDEAGQIEQRLRKAHDLLWGLLVPRMNYEISKGRTLLSSTDTSTPRANLIRREIDRMAEEIQAQKVREALESRRFLRLELASITPKVARVRRSFIE
jgi:hypothetical protein